MSWRGRPVSGSLGETIGARTNTPCCFRCSDSWWASCWVSSSTSTSGSSYDNRIFISGFLVNAIVAVLLTFIGDRLGLDLYLVALITFGLRIFDNVALIRRHFL